MSHSFFNELTKINTENKYTHKNINFYKTYILSLETT